MEPDVEKFAAEVDRQTARILKTCWQNAKAADLPAGETLNLYIEQIQQALYSQIWLRLKAVGQ